MRRIDCGGAHFVVIRYGNFYEFVKPISGGHLSVGMELTRIPWRWSSRSKPRWPSTSSLDHSSAP